MAEAAGDYTFSIEPASTPSTILVTIKTISPFHPFDQWIPDEAFAEQWSGLFAKTLPASTEMLIKQEYEADVITALTENGYVRE